MMESNMWSTPEALAVLKIVRKGATDSARKKKLCRATCKDLAQEVVSRLLERPYVVLRDPYAYGWRAGYFRACSYLRRKYAAEKFLEEQKLRAPGQCGDVLAFTIAKEEQQDLNALLTTLPMEDLVLIYGSAALGHPVAFMASLINKANGTNLTTEAYRARLLQLKKRIRSSLATSA